MTSTQQHLDDAERTRLDALHRLDVLDKPRRSDLDGLARLAAHVCQAPQAAINLIDTERQWPAAAHGWDPNEIPRCDSMCAATLDTHDISFTSNAALDPRWLGNPHTTGELAAMRFYASAPLILAGGEVVGTLCVHSELEQSLGRDQIERLRDLAELAVALLELRQETERLGHAALRDPLTRLPNRALFAESLERAVAARSRTDAAPAVLFLDIDGFKQVNDTHGHAAGDELLRELAGRLVRTVRASDLVARLGGDEFVVLCSGTAAEPAELDVLIERLRHTVGEPVVLTSAPGRPAVHVGVSIGAATAGPSDTGDDLLLRADAAMYDDKQVRRARLLG